MSKSTVAMLAVQAVVLAIAAVATSQYLSVRTRIEVAAGDVERFAEREAPVESAAVCACEESAPCVCSCEPVACECPAPPACVTPSIPMLHLVPLPALVSSQVIVADMREALASWQQDLGATMRFTTPSIVPRTARVLDQRILRFENSSGFDREWPCDDLNAGDACRTHPGDALEEVARFDDVVLVRVVRPEHQPVRGCICPIGTLTFVPSQWFDTLEEAYEREQRQREWRPRAVQEAEAALLHDAR